MNFSDLLILARSYNQQVPTALPARRPSSTQRWLPPGRPACPNPAGSCLPHSQWYAGSAGVVGDAGIVEREHVGRRGNRKRVSTQGIFDSSSLSPPWWPRSLPSWPSQPVTQPAWGRMQRSPMRRRNRSDGLPGPKKPRSSRSRTRTTSARPSSSRETTSCASSSLPGAKVAEAVAPAGRGDDVPFLVLARYVREQGGFLGQVDPLGHRVVDLAVVGGHAEQRAGVLAGDGQVPVVDVVEDLLERLPAPPNWARAVADVVELHRVDDDQLVLAGASRARVTSSRPPRRFL